MKKMIMIVALLFGFLCVNPAAAENDVVSDPKILQEEINENVWTPCVTIRMEREGEAQETIDTILPSYLHHRTGGAFDRQIMGLVLGSERDMRFIFYGVFLKSCLKNVGIIEAEEAQDSSVGMEAFNSGDYEAALQEFRPLAEQGDDDAQLKVGIMYYEGAGVSQDYGEAMIWFRMAAEQGNDSAQTRLGIMHYDGKGVSQNFGEAVKWFRMAAEQGADHARYRLGEMYYEGKGVIQDYVLAHAWYNLAAVRGSLDGWKMRIELQKSMTAEQIAEAQRLASKWLKDRS